MALSNREFTPAEIEAICNTPLSPTWFPPMPVGQARPTATFRWPIPWWRRVKNWTVKRWPWRTLTVTWAEIAEAGDG